ncbi:hypothetical protein D3C71_23850 [compost metagenome]
MKNKEQMAPFRWSYLRQGLRYANSQFNLGVLPVLGLIVTLGVYLVAPAYWGYSLAAFALAYLAVWWLGVRELRREVAANELTFLKGWVDGAQTDQERAYRQSLWNSQGSTAAMAAAGAAAVGGSLAAPAFNVDGTPMVPGSSMDLNGNVYGMTPMTTGDWNTDTGQFIAENNSYAAPMGMDERP